MKLHEGFLVILRSVFSQAIKSEEQMKEFLDKISIKKKTETGWIDILTNDQLKEIIIVLKTYEEAKEKSIDGVVAITVYAKKEEPNANTN